MLKARALVALMALSVSAALQSSALAQQAQGWSPVAPLPSPPPSLLSNSWVSTRPMQAEDEKHWNFLIQPYGLLASIEGDAAVGTAPNLAVDLDFGTILDNLDAAGMLHGEVHHDSGWGVILDYGFMDLGADRTGPLGVVLDVGVRQGILEAFINRRYAMEGGATLDAFAGVRWWDIDLDLSTSPGPVARNRSVDWYDPVLGTRVIAPFGGDWSFLGRGDIGGFGIESDFSWSASAGLGYSFNDTFALELHYRALGVDYEENAGSSSAFGYDTITHGPLIGLSIYF